MATKKNSYGREYLAGKATGRDMRSLIVQEIIEAGANLKTGEVPRGVYTKIADKFKINRQSVTNFWKRYVSEGSISQKKKEKTMLGRRKLNEPDVRLIEFIKKENPSITARELKDKLLRYSPASANVDVSTIYRTMARDLDFTFKRLHRPSGDRFTPRNMRYTQAYLDFCQTKRPHQIKFMDESGFKLVTTNRNYGHSKKGEQCIEIGRFIEGANLTLNCLIGLDCVLYFNFVDGPSNSERYLNFWHEASLSQDCYDRPTFLPGDLIIVDNCAIHHNQSERILNTFFNMQGIDYGFLPVYSPDLNPIEICFSKIKTVIKQERFKELVSKNLKLAVIKAIQEINQSDIQGFYRHTGYFNV
ncbi:uncharacterized protein LOC143056700 [Mytilus galloprovincialis]|uniref:uncharacterized protein LOC143056700 n=1 Tax=Mytilus galloprovincialis TaxID=29158 RepID=UPI003F7C97D7